MYKFHCQIIVQGSHEMLQACILTSFNDYYEWKIILGASLVVVALLGEFGPIPGYQADTPVGNDNLRQQLFCSYNRILCLKESIMPM